MTLYRYQQYIAGEWTDAADGGTWDVLNPATEQVIRTVPYGGRADAEAAIEAAAQAFPKWAEATAYERAAILKKAAEIIRVRLDDLAKTLTQESGKPLAQSRGDWAAAADLSEWFAEEGKRAYGRIVPARRNTRRQLVLKQPLGVVGVITAWNFPAYNPARAVAAALAAGCTVVLRPSEYTPLTAMEMVQIFEEAGLPAGVLNLINGDPDGMGQAMLDHPAVRRISFTGSTRVGRILMDGASRTFTRLGLELGGNAPVLVFPDVDVQSIAAGAVTAKFRNNGQVCVSPQRFFVHSQVVEEFLDVAAAEIAKQKLGDGLNAETTLGPLINARQRDRVEALVAQSRADGAEILIGGSRPDELPQGYFYNPTLVTNVGPDSRLAQEEIFGPVLPVFPFTEPEEALELANKTPYGLAANIFTRDLNTALYAAERLEFGMVGLNEWYPQSTEVPFPGWKQSGMGLEAGAEGLGEYLETKVVALGL